MIFLGEGIGFYCSLSLFFLISEYCLAVAYDGAGNWAWDICCLRQESLCITIMLSSVQGFRILATIKTFFFNPLSVFLLETVKISGEGE